MSSESHRLGDELLSLSGLAAIAKDQQKFLDRPNSWHTEVKSNPNGLARVPDHVIESVKAAYIASRDARTVASAKSSQQRHRTPAGSSEHNVASSPLSRQSQDSPPPRSSPPPQSSRRSSLPAQISRRSSMQGTPSPSPSPSPSSRGPETTGRIQSSVINETPSLRPQPPRRPSDFNFPSSVDEEDLEVEVPQAANTTQQRSSSSHVAMTQPSTASSQFDRNLSKMETPPCAQPNPPPSTGSPRKRGSPESLTMGIEQRRTKRMKPILFSGPDTLSVAPKSNVALTTHRMASTKTFVQIESSLSTDTDSIVPATFQEQDKPVPSTFPPQSPQTSQRDQELEGEKNSDIEMEDAPTEEQQETEPNSHQTSNPNEDQPSPDNVQQIAILRQPSSPVASARRSVPPEAEKTPLDDFVARYPPYANGPNADVWTFVRACVCLEHMQKSNALRECLWDDFIRAFAHEYLGYIKTASKPQPALEWFNQLEGPLSFNQRVVHRQNLDAILQSYPQEVARARGLISGHDKALKLKTRKPTASTQQTRLDRQAETGKSSPAKGSKIPLANDIPVSSDNLVVRPEPQTKASQPAKSLPSTIMEDAPATPVGRTQPAESERQETPIAPHSATNLSSLPADKTPNFKITRASPIQAEHSTKSKHKVSAEPLKQPVGEGVPASQVDYAPPTRPERQTGVSTPAPTTPVPTTPAATTSLQGIAIEHETASSRDRRHTLADHMSVVSPSISSARPARQSPAPPSSAGSVRSETTYLKRLSASHWRKDQNQREKLRKFLEKKKLKQSAEASGSATASS